VHSKLLLRSAKMDFAVKTDSGPARKSACLRFGNPLKNCPIDGAVVRLAKEKIEISP
jgi:hypothetical protein